MKKSIWVIEQGCYSDYRVVGVFSSEASARQIADAINAPDEGKYESDEATVKEWPLDPGVDELRQGFTPYRVQMQEDGTIDDLRKEHVSGYELAGDVRMWRRSTAPAYIGKGVKDVLQAMVWAKDEAHAVKIVNEHRTRMIATGEWASDDPASPRLQGPR